MRTTVTIEADVEQKLREFMHRNRYTFKQALNESLRRGLGNGTPEQSRPSFTVKARALNLKSGLDLTRLNELNDEIEVEAFLQKNRGLEENLSKAPHNE